MLGHKLEFGRGQTTETCRGRAAIRRSRLHHVWAANCRGHKTHGCWPWTRLDSGAAGINWGLQCAESAPLAFPCRPLQPGKALRQPLAGECAAALHVPANAAAAAVTSACEHADHCTRYWSVVSQYERASLLRRRHAGGRWSCPAPSSAFTTSGPPQQAQRSTLLPFFLGCAARTSSAAAALAARAHPPAPQRP